MRINQTLAKQHKRVTDTRDITYGTGENRVDIVWDFVSRQQLTEVGQDAVFANNCCMVPVIPGSQVHVDFFEVDGCAKFVVNVRTQNRVPRKSHGKGALYRSWFGGFDEQPGVPFCVELDPGVGRQLLRCLPEVFLCRLIPPQLYRWSADGVMYRQGDIMATRVRSTVVQQLAVTSPWRHDTTPRSLFDTRHTLLPEDDTQFLEYSSSLFVDGDAVIRAPDHADAQLHDKTAVARMRVFSEGKGD